MPVFSCGGMRYQQSWQDMPFEQIEAAKQANLADTVARSLELGINHIETARGYGSSERQLGQILPEYPREKLIVQTKVGPEADPAKFVANFEDSLARLNLGYVDLLAIHGINNQETLDWSIGKDGKGGGCLEAARRIQAKGLARHIGFSTHGPTQVLLKAVNHMGGRAFDYINLHWFYIFQRNWPVVEAATQHNMGVFIISPSDKGGMLYKPSEKLLELTRPLHPIVFNDLFCLTYPTGGRPLVHTLSIGASRPTDFDLHVQALEHLAEAPKLLGPIVERMETTLTRAVGKDLANPFTLNLPEPEETPGGVNIPIILWLRSLALAFDMVDYGKMRYNLLGNGGHWFPGQNAAKVDELDLSAIEKASGLGRRLKGLLKEAHQMLGGEAVKRLSQSK